MLIRFFAWTLGLAAPSVQWSAPESCPDEATAAATIAAGLESESESALDVVTRVTESEDGYLAQVRVSSKDGETTRTLSSPSCATLVDAVALIAVAAQGDGPVQVQDPQSDANDPDPASGTIIDPAAAPVVDTLPAKTETELTAAQDGEQSDARPLARSRPDPVVRPPRPAARPVSPHVRAFGRLGWGVTPLVDGGGGLAVGLSWSRLRGEVFAEGLAPTVIIADPANAISIDVWAWSAGVRGCGIVWASSHDRLALPLCAAASIGQMIGQGQGEALQGSSTHRDVWAAVRAGPGVVVRLFRGLSLVADIEALVPLRRPGFEVRGVRNTYRPAQIGVAGTIGLELHFGRRKGTGTGI